MRIDPKIHTLNIRNFNDSMRTVDGLSASMLANGISGPDGIATAPRAHRDFLRYSVKNTSASQIEEDCFVEITGCVNDQDYLEIQLPSADAVASPLVAITEDVILADGYGYVYIGGARHLIGDSSETSIAVGDKVGTKSASGYAIKQDDGPWTVIKATHLTDMTWELYVMPAGGGGGGDKIHIAYPVTDATESNIIICWLDYDGTDPGVWSHKAWLLGDALTGSDSEIYSCTSPYTSVDDTTKPITGANWATRWVKITQIDVYCSISGGGNLDLALPYLLTVHKDPGYDGTPPSTWAVGTYYGEGPPAAIVTGSDGETYSCILGHTATSANKPCSGNDWETNWKLAKLFPDDLLVIKIGDWWYALSRFQASMAGAIFAP